jgi:hypothetical protein
MPNNRVDPSFLEGSSAIHFTPSGIDDYCLQNRDFARAGEGNLYCLKVSDSLSPRVWFVNQHVAPTFRFSAEQRERMRVELMKRITILKEMSPCPEPNYAIDESWAAIHPYGIVLFCNEIRYSKQCPQIIQ